MYKVGQKVSVFPYGSSIWRQGEITEITQERDTQERYIEVTLDNGERVHISFDEAENRIIEVIDEEGSLFGYIDRLPVPEKFKLALRVIVVGLIITLIATFGWYFMRAHHATPKVEKALNLPQKTQIQIWTDKMAELEKEKAEHYERQKYLKSENAKEVEKVKSLDRQINKLKDKIHLYISPTDNEEDR